MSYCNCNQLRGYPVENGLDTFLLYDQHLILT